MAMRPFMRELDVNEAHSWMYLLQHKEEFGVACPSRKKKVSDARGKCRMIDAMMPFNAFSQHVSELNDSSPLVVRVRGGPELTMEIRATLMALMYAKLFRVYHRQVMGMEPKLMQYGLTMKSHERVV